MTCRTSLRQAFPLGTAQTLPRLLRQTRFAFPTAFRSPAESRESVAARRRERFREVTVARPSLSACGSAGSGAGFRRAGHGPRLAATVAGLSRPGTAVTAAERAARQPALPEPPRHGGRARPRRGTSSGSWQVRGPRPAPGRVQGRCKAGVCGPALAPGRKAGLLPLNRWQSFQSLPAPISQWRPWENGLQTSRAQWVKSLAIRPPDLSSIPRTHVAREESPELSYDPSCTVAYRCHTSVLNKYLLKSQKSRNK